MTPGDDTPSLLGKVNMEALIVSILSVKQEMSEFQSQVMGLNRRLVNLEGHLNSNQTTL